ncbi:MAG: bis(5'-nucleosyl)-tetraphosphatase (symmetrical) YqeK [Brevinema sp.]
MSKINDYQSILIKSQEYSISLVLESQKILLSEKRFAHVDRVREKAKEISKRANLSTELTQKIDQAVLMHDFAKGMSSDELAIYAELYGIKLGNIVPSVYHAIVGAWMMETFFMIKDPQVLDAVRYHTTGHISFIDNIVGEVLFLADYLEPKRTHTNTHIDQLIPNNMLEAQYMVVKEKIISVVERNRVLSKESLLFYHALIKELKI